MIRAKVVIDNGDYIVAKREETGIPLPVSFMLRIPQMHVDFKIHQPSDVDNPVIKAEDIVNE